MINKLRLTFSLLVYLTLATCAQESSQVKKLTMDEPLREGLEIATLGAGCFWCVEAVYQSLEGVESVVSGYSGGNVDNPSYIEVCNGTTGHAEVCQIGYDPEVITYAEVLEAFWASHDPTTLNRQGADRGTQYRSAIFYHDDEQKNIAEKSKEAAQSSGAWNSPIVTEITSFTEFFEADASHQDYYSNNPNASYCTYVINPKLEKFKKEFRDKLKEEAK